MAMAMKVITGYLSGIKKKKHEPYIGVFLALKTGITRAFLTVETWHKPATVFFPKKMPQS